MPGPRTPSARRVAALLLGVASLLPFPAAGAQSVDPAEYASRSIARVALLDLRTRVMPTPDDYMIAGQVLGSAQAFQPDDTELLRTRIRAAWSAGNADELDALTRELVRLDPGDTVAQLRLASSRLRRLQTAEERLGAYDRLLGPSGASIDPSVRSRLALDAALLCRERNDFQGFVDRLTQATQLDVSNKEAAALCWSYFGPLVDTRAERLELLLNLLRADPTDPNIHRQVAFELALAGAFPQARRFHSHAVRLFTALDPNLDQNISLESLAITWQVAGPHVVVKALNDELTMMRQQAALRIMQWEQARMPTDSLPRPETILLNPAFNQVRLVAAIAADDRETVRAALADMGAASNQVAQQAQEVAQLSTPEERTQRSLQLWSILVQQLVAIAWADASTDSLNQWADRAAGTFGEEMEITRTLRAWAALRLGDPGAAEPLFRAFPKEMVLNRVGLALTLEKLGRNDEARQELHALATGYPLSLSGVWARERYRRDTGLDPMATEEREAVDRIAASVPEWLDRMTMDPRTFTALQAQLVDESLPATGRARLRVRLTNLAPQPLALGGDRSINSRFLLSPRLETGAGQHFAKVLPEVAELDRRLRLMPSESLEVEIWPDPGLVGWLAEVGAIETVRERWRVMQGYTLDAEGVPTPGVLCLETETRGLVRAPLELGRVGATELADALDAASQGQLPGVVAAVRARALLEPGTPYSLAGDDLLRIASIAADRYPHLPPAARAMMLAVLPTGTAAPGMEAFDAVALREQDPALVPIALVSRATSPDEPALAAWLAAESEDLAALARALRTRLASPGTTFSRLNAASLRASASVAGGEE